MLHLRHSLRFSLASLALAMTAAWGAVDINDLQVTNVGTTTFTVVWTTSEVSTPGLQVFLDSSGISAVTASLGRDYYPIAEGDPGVVNDAAARISRRGLELLATNRRVVSVRVTGLAPGTTYYLRPRTFSSAGVDNGSAVVPLRQVKTATVSSMVADSRLLRVRFRGLNGEGLVALLEGPAGTTPLSAMISDSAAADSAIFSLAGMIDTVTGTNALLDVPAQVAIRVIGAGAPTGIFTHTVDFITTFRPAKLDVIEVGEEGSSPVFTVQPESKTAQVGASVTFSATATGTPTPTYKWQRLPSGSPTWSDVTNGSVYSGAATGTLTLTGLTLAMSGDQFRCVAGNAVSPDATSSVATLTVVAGPIAPTITTQPADVAVMLGASVTFAVVATGSPTPTFQWKKGGVDLPGATDASLTLSDLKTADAGTYTVVVSNAGGSVTSSAASVAVIDAQATHTLVGGGYTAGSTLTVSNALSFSSADVTLRWRVVLPSGWSYASGGGNEGDVKPRVGDVDLLEWAWTSTPPKPLNFTYTVNVPAGTKGDQQIAALVLYRQPGAYVEFLAKPDPLAVQEVKNHSADGNADYQISLYELTRVIELFNARSGTVRTGAYRVDPAGEDGFNPEPTRQATATVTLTRYHSGDSNRDGKLSLFELTRVIELFNYRSGTSRTGEYHIHPGSEDGFGLGPISGHPGR